MGRIMDDKDRELISLLEENPELSQREIADNLGLSQPSVGMRLKKLTHCSLMERLQPESSKKMLPNTSHDLISLILHIINQ